MSNNVPRSMAQDVSRWYFSHLDPFRCNESNIHSHLRTPLIALTVKTLQTRPFDIETSNGAATGGNVEISEEKKHSLEPSTNGGWRDYVQGEDNSAKEQAILQEEFASLSRRIKARMEAFLAGCALAVPGREKQVPESDAKKETAVPTEKSTISLQDGLSGFGTPRLKPNQRVPSLREKMGRSMIGETPDPNMVKHPQIAREDLVVRLELYVRTLQRLRNLKEDCVIAMEPPKVIRARARYTTNAFVATATYVRSIGPVLTRLLHCLTMEMLAVECVSDEITKIIHSIACKYEHRTSFASLAFLSTPEVNAGAVLTPLIVQFLQHLQGDWERLVKECELERVLTRTLDPSMRKLFKTVEFQSIGHLLEVCYNYRSKLQAIELPPNLCATAENVGTLCNNHDAIRQALRDLRREIITVNGHVLPPVTSRKELVSMLTQTLNSRTLTANSPKMKKPKGTRNRQAKSRRPSSLNPSDLDSSSEGASSNEGSRKKFPIMPSFEKNGMASDTSGYESPMLSSSGYDSSLAMDSPVEKARAAKLTPPRRKRRGTLHLSAIDTLTRRLLIAASRTGNGGDAYFFV